MNSVRSLKRRYSILLTVLLIVLVGYFLATLIGLKADINAQAAENEQLSQQLEDQLEENRELEALVNSEDKDSYMERVAREKYGYAGADERVYYAADAS